MSTSGFVKSFLPSKGYGFISGEDGRDYFFHGRDVIGGARPIGVLDGLQVVFEPGVTAKGYRAYRVRFEDVPDGKFYEVPREFLVSKLSEIKGWEIVRSCDWIVVASGRGDPLEVKEQAKRLAASVGANGLTDLEYAREKGHEGNYIFTLHVVTGRPVFLARKSSSGSFLENDFPNISSKCAEIENRWTVDFNNAVVLIRNNWRRAKVKAALLLVCFLLFIFIGIPFLALVSIALSLSVLAYYWELEPKKQGFWLRRIK